MKNKAIQSFLNMITGASAVILTDQQESKLIMFNGYLKPEEFLLAIEEKRKAAIFEFASNITGISSNLNAYITCFIIQFKEALACFSYKNHLLYHQNLTLIDAKGMNHDPTNLEPSIIKSLQPYFKIQRDAALAFIDILEKSKEAGITAIERLGGDENVPTPQEGIQWISSIDVCKKLNIALRTLLRYRASGIIPYTIIGGKYYYNMAIVNKIFSDKLLQSGKTGGGQLISPSP